MPNVNNNDATTQDLNTVRTTQIPMLAIIGWPYPSGVAHAELENADGNTVSTWCSTKANEATAAMQAGSCLGYLWSIVDIQTLGGAVNGRKAFIPRNADMGQMVDLFKNYVREHPEKRHLLAANLAAEAFASAFPCRP
jgi:hypothetical protein